MTWPEPFFAAGEHAAIDLPGARALFTTRRGGVSRGAYATLNLGAFTEDERAAVLENLRLLQDAAGGRLAWRRQVHGTRVAVLGAELGARGAADDADGAATDAPGVAPMVLTADCLAIAVAGGGAVSVVHAGWRGLADGVIANGVGRLRELAGSAAGDDLEAAIGPHARVCCYEVGEEVLARFDPEARRGRHLDMTAVAVKQLQAAGVRRVHDLGACTICSDRSLFFSHRRDAGVTGRQGGLAWLS